ncbi:Mce protein [Mycobacterium sp. pUA109]|uniref:Mce protein n=1 Tax=Mycobacterium sp. pUA109 TaxID=3238982 RepID=UPI00351BAC67
MGTELAREVTVFKQAPTVDVFDQLAGQDDPDAVNAAAAEVGGEDTDESVDPAGESGDDGGGDLAAAPGTLRRRVVRILVGVAVVAGLGFSAFLGWRLIQVDQTAAAGQAALAAAKKYAVTLTTLDAADIDKQYSEAMAGATGQFRDEYGQGSSQLRQILIDNKASGKGVVLDAAVKSATKTRVEVLLFVDQSVQNAVLSTPRVDRNRVQMTMELVDGRWLASNVEII